MLPFTVLLLSSFVVGQASNCQESLDLVFVLDSSGSIRDKNPSDNSYDNWNLLLQFVARITESLYTLTNGNLRVGLVRYSEKAFSDFYLNEITDLTQLKNRILSTSYIGSYTNTSGGLREMNYNQFVSSRGDRSNAQNVAIVITDGESNVDDQRTVPDAQEARNRGIMIYTMGVTNAINENEIRQISSSPQQVNVTYFTATDFTTLDATVNNLVQAAGCSGQNTNNQGKQVCPSVSPVFCYILCCL